MNNMNLSVREWERKDIELIVNYFVNSDANFLKAMGADKSKLPDKKEWIEKLNLEFDKSNEEQEFYYIIWFLNKKPIGHSNINNIDFGKSATMHLHMWYGQNRNKGLGLTFIKQTIPYYFKNFDLETLICEPYAKNIAPNNVINKSGFEFIKEYKTTPGWINFRQTVTRYEMTRNQFEYTKTDLTN